MSDSNDSTNETAPDERELQRVGSLLRGAMPAPSFAPGFADRAMARVAASRAAAPPTVLRVAAMQRNFRVLAAAAAVAIVALGLNNVVLARSDGTTLVEAAIGLQPVSAESVLSYTTGILQ
jgi:hypothetical protein